MIESTGYFEVTIQNEREIALTKIFAASRADVFEAWTRPEHVRQWWDPSGVPLAACEIDLRPKGAFRWVNSAHGADHVFSGMYLEIVAPERLVFSVKMFPSRPDPVATLAFTQMGNKTRLVMTIACQSIEDRDAMLQMKIDVGTGRTLENLAGYLDREFPR